MHTGRPHRRTSAGVDSPFFFRPLWIGLHQFASVRISSHQFASVCISLHPLHPSHPSHPSASMAAPKLSRRGRELERLRNQRDYIDRMPLRNLMEMVEDQSTEFQCVNDCGWTKFAEIMQEHHPDFTYKFFKASVVGDGMRVSHPGTEYEANIYGKMNTREMARALQHLQCAAMHKMFPPGRSV